MSTTSEDFKDAYVLAHRHALTGSDEALGSLERLLEGMSVSDLMLIAQTGITLTAVANSTGRIVLRAPYELPGPEQ
jgi:hypothetical protein